MFRCAGPVGRYEKGIRECRQARRWFNPELPPQL